MHEDRVEPWWLNVTVKLKLSHIYKIKGMLEAFVDVIYPIIYESLKVLSMHHRVIVFLQFASPRSQVSFSCVHDCGFGSFEIFFILF